MFQLRRQVLLADRHWSNTPSISSVFEENKIFFVHHALPFKNQNYESIFFYTYSTTDNFLSPIPVSDWLILCYGNMILHQKKKKGK